MTTQPRIIRFLQRPGAKETWRYERVPFLLVELMCLLAGIWAAPTAHAKQLLAIALPLALWGAELARAARSGAARKAEIAAAMGVPLVKLACERQLEMIAKNMQLVTATAPIIALVMSVANSSGADATKAAIVGTIVFVVRWSMVEAMGVWRKWYREHVPVMITVTVPVRKSAANEYEDWRPTEGLLTNVINKAAAQYEHPRIIARVVDAYLRERVETYSAKGDCRIAGETASQAAARAVREFAAKTEGSPNALAPMSPYQSAQLAQMAEQILQAKDKAS